MRSPGAGNTAGGAGTIATSAGSVHRIHIRRRPTGAPPPLPRRVGASGKVWLTAFAALLVWVVLSQRSDAVLRATDRADSAVLRWIAVLRSGWLTDVATAIDWIGSGWCLTVLGIGTLVALMVFRRWWHLLTFVGSVFVLELVGETLYQLLARPRPYDVTILGRWAGFSMPAPPVAVLAMVLVGVAYTLVVPGRPRSIAKWVIGGVLVVYALARLYLGTNHPSDVLAGAALGVAIPLNAFRLFTPNEVFPVNYRRGKTAHLDVGGRRGEALRRAIQDQLGLTVTEVMPFRLEGSGGSTPLRLTVAGDPETYVFGKLYAMSHVRADRWYKLGRTLLYGRLEDEARFQSVRRLVSYEDYALRLLRDAGVPTAAPLGVVEMTPEREYLLVTEFLHGAEEINDVDVTDDMIDEGLTIIRHLWDSGVAHRDIKPANLLVANGHVVLIDVAFVQVRPSPWRQAVDLANMMLVLAVRSDAERVYVRALRFFHPDEIAEAFAAARGVASPSQLRAVMKRDGRDLLAQFRALAPPRSLISLQRWSVPRVALGAAVIALIAVVVPNAAGMFAPAHDLPLAGQPDCGSGNLMVLMAQAVPTATLLPCISTVPAGWSLGSVNVEKGSARFSLDSDRARGKVLTVSLLPPEDCDTAGAMPVPSDEAGALRLERVEQLPPQLRSTRYYLFEGGCVTYRFAFGGRATPALLFDADSAVGLQPRSAVVDEVRRSSGQRLCGAGAPCD